MKRDYSMLRRSYVDADQLKSLEFDVFVSAFDDSERVRTVFDGVTAARKVWLLHPEYEYVEADLLANEYYRPDADADEVVFWRSLFERILDSESIATVRVGIDISAVMRPHIALLPKMAKRAGLSRIEVLYADPRAYTHGSDTRFATGAIESVAQIPTFEGLHPDEGNDVLVLGVGYDHASIRKAADSKRSATHYLLVSLPSLRPHMYQESLLNLTKAKESLRRIREQSFLYAPGNDPFVTAQVLSDQLGKLRNDDPDVNVYYCPLGTKAQVLGTAWFLSCEQPPAVSMIFPYSPTYSRGSSMGLSRVNHYHLELDWIPQ